MSLRGALFATKQSPSWTNVGIASQKNARNDTVSGSYSFSDPKETRSALEGRRWIIRLVVLIHASHSPFRRDILLPCNKANRLYYSTLWLVGKMGRFVL